jgi:AcrR family transcriptional regulator
MPGRPRTVEPAELRSRVEAAAALTFAQKGFESATVDEIVAKAEVSKPSFYRSYGSKSALYCVLIETHAANTARVALEALSGTVGTIEQKLPAMIDAWFEHVGGNPDLFRLLPNDGDIQAACKRVASLQVANDKSLIRQFAPGLPPKEVDPIAEVIRAALVALGMWWLDQQNVSRTVPVNAMLRVCDGILLASSKTEPPRIQMKVT